MTLVSDVGFVKLVANFRARSNANREHVETSAKPRHAVYILQTAGLCGFARTSPFAADVWKQIIFVGFFVCRDENRLTYALNKIFNNNNYAIDYFFQHKHICFLGRIQHFFPLTHRRVFSNKNLTKFYYNVCCNFGRVGELALCTWLLYINRRRRDPAAALRVRYRSRWRARYLEIVTLRFAHITRSACPGKRRNASRRGRTSRLRNDTVKRNLPAKRLRSSVTRTVVLNISTTRVLSAKICRDPRGFYVYTIKKCEKHTFLRHYTIEKISRNPPKNRLDAVVVGVPPCFSLTCVYIYTSLFYRWISQRKPLKKIPSDYFYNKKKVEL